MQSEQNTIEEHLAKFREELKLSQVATDEGIERITDAEFQRQLLREEWEQKESAE